MPNTLQIMRNVLAFGLLGAITSAFAVAGDVIELDSGAAPDHPQQPQIAVDTQGAIHVVYGIGDRVRYCRSQDGGKSFSEPIEFEVTQNMSLGMRRGPRIAVSGGSVCVTAIGGKQGKGRDGDLLAIQSSDGGKTWGSPVQVNDVPASAREGLHAMAAGQDGNMLCVWLDLRSRKTELMSSVSTDGGRTWNANALVYRSPDGSICECCHPSVTIDDKGHAHVHWRNSLSGARDIYYAVSTDGCKSFGNATKLGTGTWPLDACPMDGGAIAVLQSGKLASVWRRDRQVYLTSGKTQDEQLLGVGEQPWIAAAKDGPYVVWLKKRGDVAFLLPPGGKAPVELARHAYDPVIAAASNGQGPVVAAWEVRDGKNYKVQCRIVTD